MSRQVIIVEYMVKKFTPWAMKQRKEKGLEAPHPLQGCMAFGNSWYPNYQTIPKLFLLRGTSTPSQMFLLHACAHLCNLSSHVILEGLSGQPVPGLLLRAYANQMSSVFSVLPYDLKHNLSELAYYFQASIFSPWTRRRDAG